jgi:hypothetical protein
MPTLWLVFLLLVVPPPRPCAATVVLMDGFDGYYAVYWNGRLRGQGHFVTNASLGAAQLKSQTWDDPNIGLCIGPVADRNEWRIRDRAGKTVLRRSYRKQEVPDLLLVYKNDHTWSVTSRQGTMVLE